MIEHLAILGASGHGKVIADTAALNPKWQKISFFDDNWPDMDCDLPWPVIGDTYTLLENLGRYTGVVIGIGNNTIRQKKHDLLVEHKAPIVTVIHPQAYISSFTSIDCGSVVFAGAVININSSIGRGCIINTGATVDHDCKLADFVHISPGVNLGGSVEIGEKSWIGIGSSVKQCTIIGADVVVGAGSAVVKSLLGNQLVAGVPARTL